MEQGQRLAEEGFAADAGEQRAAQGQQLMLAGEQGEVLAAALAESVAGVEDDGLGAMPAAAAWARLASRPD